MLAAAIMGQIFHGGNLMWHQPDESLPGVLNDPFSCMTLLTTFTANTAHASEWGPFLLGYLEPI